MKTQAAHLSHSQLVIRRFLRHRLGIFGAVMTFLIYLVAAFVEFLAPHTPGSYQARDVYAPPQSIRWILESPEGRRFQPHVYGLRSTTDYNTGQRVFEEDPDRVIELGFFVRGDDYRFWGLVPSNLHFIGPEDPGERVYFLGADRLGRDVLSRTIYATRVSMTIGLVGVGLSVILGIAIGGISGYFGGFVDLAIQRLIEFLQSLPSIPLWIGLAAAIPPTTPPIRTYFFITAILSIIGWDRACAGGARAVHGAEGRGFHQIRTPRRQPAGTDHPEAYGTQFPVAHHCRGHAGDSGNDHSGNIAEFPRYRTSAPGRKLGRAAAGGTKPEINCHRTLVVPSRGGGRRGRSVTQFPLATGFEMLQTPMQTDALLSLQDLTVSFRDGRRRSVALRDVGFDLPRSRTVAIVGESGCGKSLTARSILRILDSNATIDSGQILFEGVNLAGPTEKDPVLRSIRGGRIGLIYQEPLTALSSF